MSGFLFIVCGASCNVPKFAARVLTFLSLIAIASTAAAASRKTYYSEPHPPAKLPTNTNTPPSVTSSPWTLHYATANSTGKLQSSRRADLQLPTPDTALHNPVTHLSIPAAYQPTSEYGYYVDSSNHMSHQGGYKNFHHQHAPKYNHYKSHKHGNEHSSFEVEDKVFSKTVAATKALKIGKVIFTFVMVLVLLLLAGIAKLGVSLSPVVLPLALLPIGIVALILFVPLFLLFVPLVAIGAAGGEGRRRRRRNVERLEGYNQLLDSALPKILDQIEKMKWEN